MLFGQKWKFPVELVRPTYNSWQSMRSRCFREEDVAYPNYGGRGITVCERWRDDFDAFLEDMGTKPEGFSIERVDNDRGYEPENCIWADRKTQNSNTRRNHFLTTKTEPKR